ncbi:uncharacterized protein MYCFIDRAFT_84230 [Pseudocercospora fijiensis CIRAD86]|uniref:Methyltransferase domain-containing protein n=1 Tax=Pseudocercospora fijiensis (strain CIRAD86) TaxID=383855 RepID=N1Q5M1_PSEFD|nr:uncharacterized protein MYCFIDRAFT_84230 [Pseudocercospora fijiensis CIRAD86]EME87174.1 hypothetical protein MYCFIDRAFT_84230 [Pseudocercospora fijiensis CIRAD86]
MLQSSSTSLISSARQFHFEYGRRYHGYNAGKYHFPNDEVELNRMDIEHYNQKLQLDGKLHLCPPDDPKQVLDVGTGTGIWCIETADKYPECEVIGTDLRFLMGSITSHAELYKKVYSALKPGCWLELVEIECGSTFSDDDTVPKDAPSKLWWKLLEEAFEKIGRPIPKIHRFPKLLEDAGFENVHFQMIKRPVNDWPKDPKMKEIGRYSRLNYLEGLEGFTMAPFTRVLGWTPEEAQVLIAKVRNETVTRKFHGWQKGVVCYAQKPLGSAAVAGTAAPPPTNQA